MALVQQKPEPAAAAIDGENALLIQPIAMRHVANRDHLMTFPGRRISGGEPSVEATVLRSPESGNPAVVDMAGLINMNPLSLKLVSDRQAYFKQATEISWSLVLEKAEQLLHNKTRAGPVQ